MASARASSDDASATASPPGISAYFATSPSPARYSRGGSVASVRDVGEHRDRLVERADEVLALGRLTAVLPPIAASTCASSVVGACTTVDATVVHGGGEAGGVADHSAAERDDRVAAQQTPRGEPRAQVVDGGERLGLLAVADQEQVGLGAGGAGARR